MSDLIFVRHAETDMAGTYCGHSDPELNARGYAQLDEIVGKLRSADVREIYSSDLRRAITTANAIAAAFSIEPHVRPALREINFGFWEGLTWSEIEKQDPDYAQRWMAEYPTLSAPGGEQFCHFEQRVLDEVNAVAIRNLGRCAVVVTHAGALQVLLRRLTGCTAESAWKQTRSYGCIIRHQNSISLDLHPMEEAF